MMPETTIVYCLILFMFLDSRLIWACKLKECDNWRITVIPLLTEDFNHFNFLKSLVRILIEDCIWYVGNTQLRFLNKHGNFIRVQNFQTQEAIDDKLDEFTYAYNESESAYFVAIKSAISEMPRPKFNHGNYIFIATDFDRNKTSSNQELRIIDQLLRTKEVQMRSFQLEMNEVPDDTDAILNVQSVRRISSRLTRVSLTEADDLMQSIKPCRPMTQVERIRNIQHERNAQFRYWLTKNSWDVTAGLLLFLSSALIALAGFLVNIWSTKHKGDQHFLDNNYGSCTRTL